MTKLTKKKANDLIKRMYASAGMSAELFVAAVHYIMVTKQAKEFLDFYDKQYKE